MNGCIIMFDTFLYIMLGFRISLPKSFQNDIRIIGLKNYEEQT